MTSRSIGRNADTASDSVEHMSVDDGRERILVAEQLGPDESTPVAAPTESSSILQLIELTADGNTMDFKFKNSGDYSAFIAHVEFEYCPAVVSNLARAPVGRTVYYYTLNCKSVDHTLTFAADETGHGRSTDSLSMSQVVPPKGVDHLAIEFDPPSFSESGAELRK